ncbi:MAG: S8 family serine peptidase, partial [Xanthomonadales bacterium]|nr:S8 family serine peptidase [Xanthomonadales bacterium]
MHTGLRSSTVPRLALVACAALALMTGAVAAKEATDPESGLQRYIVELNDLPLALYDGRPLAASRPGDIRRLKATTLAVTGGAKLNPRSPQARAYLEYLEERHEAFRTEARNLLGNPVRPVHVYRAAVNGMALNLTEADAAALADSPLVKSIRPDTRHRLETFAGPAWIGGAAIWSGDSGFAPQRGEGVVVGLIDSGVNWESPSFGDTPLDGFTFVNPYGEQLGLCNEEEVECNDKLVGVYDFVEDDPSTEDVVEEFNNGRDNSGHGSHVASIAVGNPVSVLLRGSVNANLTGVAPRSNLISYRVCFIGDPPGPDSGGCQGSAIFSAIDQAIMDEVDVINYSIGSDARDPWSPGGVSRAFLNARSAGIVVVTSAGNSGPNPQTIGSPANAPWMVAVGNATHDTVLGSVVENLSGGDTSPPGDLIGASLTDGTGLHEIVHARDFGSALCGTGPAELQPSCDSNTGATNPWDGETPFAGKIVVCDRGTYGRIEKGKNVFLAGAVGYILANTDADGESIISDEHCLPTSHVGDQDGDSLRDWLASGSAHQGSLSGFKLAADERLADLVSDRSSRGPALAPVQDVLKPNLIAPGTSILAALDEGQQFGLLSGTSMASPHVAGAAALIKSVHPDWGANQIASAIETTATPELARVGGGTPASPHERGSGRPQLGEAVNAGLYLPVSGTQFNTANPAAGGDPKSLNLAGLVDSKCRESCSFQRTVTDLMGGGSWTAVAEGFPPGVLATVVPSAFNLANGGSRQLTVSVDLADSGIVGEWVSGSVRLSAAGSADQMLTLSVFADGGDLPEDDWTINDDRDGGWKAFPLSGLAGMPDATFRSGGLIKPTRTKKTLVRDQSRDNPYNGGEGVFTVWHELPQGGLWIYAETLASEAVDLDLFVGRDDNGNGIAEEFEELCASTSTDELERCDLFDLPPGDYWVLVQNWENTNAEGDKVTLLSAAVGPSEDSTLAASGPGIVESGKPFSVRLS